MLGHRCGAEWQFEYCKQMKGNVPHMHALQLCDVMWAMSQMHMTPPTLLVDTALQRVAAELDSVSLRELTELLHALSVLGTRPAAAWLTIVGDELLLLAAPAVLVQSAGHTQDLRHIQEQGRKSERQNEGLHDDAAGQSSRSSSSSDGSSDRTRPSSQVQLVHRASSAGRDMQVLSESVSCLCQGMCALIKLGHRPSEVWLARTMFVLQPHLHTLRPHDLPELILAVTSIRYLPAASWLAAFANRVEAVGLGALQADQLVIILEALTAIGFVGRDALMTRMSRAAQEQRSRPSTEAFR